MACSSKNGRHYWIGDSRRKGTENIGGKQVLVWIISGHCDNCGKKGTWTEPRK